MKWNAKIIWGLDWLKGSFRDPFHILAYKRVFMFVILQCTILQNMQHKQELQRKDKQRMLHRDQFHNTIIRIEHALLSTILNIIQNIRICIYMIYDAYLLHTSVSNWSGWVRNPVTLVCRIQKLRKRNYHLEFVFKWTIDRYQVIDRKMYGISFYYLPAADVVIAFYRMFEEITNNRIIIYRENSKASTGTEHSGS